MAARPRDGQAPVRHRAHRAAGGKRPAGHCHRGAPGRRLLCRQRLQDLDHERTARRPAAGPGQDQPGCAAATPRHERADDRAGHAGFHGGQGPRQARLQGTGVVGGVPERLPRPGREPARRGRGSRLAAGALRARVRARQHRRAGGGRGAGLPRPLACVRARPPRVRPAHCRVPGDPAEAGRHGDRGAGGAPAHVVGGHRARLGRAGRPRDRHGEALRLGGLHQSVARGDADPRRLRLFDGV